MHKFPLKLDPTKNYTIEIMFWVDKNFYVLSPELFGERSSA